MLSRNEFFSIFGIKRQTVASFEFPFRKIKAPQIYSH